MIPYYENLEVIKANLTFEGKLNTMAIACHGILIAINGIKTEPEQYQKHLTELWDHIGMFNVITDALEWQPNDVSNEGVEAIITAEGFWVGTIADNVRRRKAKGGSE